MSHIVTTAFDLVHWLFFIRFAVSVQVILELILQNILVGSASNDKQFLSGCIQGYGWLIMFRFSGKFLNMLNGQPSQSQTFMSKGKNIRAININALLHKIFVSKFIINTILNKHGNTCNGHNRVRIKCSQLGMYIYNPTSGFILNNKIFVQRFSIANDVNIIIHDLQYYSTDTHAIQTCKPDRITVHVGSILPKWKNFILQFLRARGVVSSHHIVWADNLHIEIYQKKLTNDDCTTHAPK